MMNAPQKTVAVAIGRWQMPHWSHLNLLQSAFDLADEVIVVIGSSWRSRNPKNPFVFLERKEMLLATMSHEQRSRVKFVGVRDVYGIDRWTDLVRGAVARHSTPQDRVIIVGHNKDASSFYLGCFPGWEFVDAGSPISVDATTLRSILFTEPTPQQALDKLSTYMHDGTLSWLSRWVQSGAFTERRAEHIEVELYKKKYPAKQYYTGDAIIEAGGHFLMIERGGTIGHGLLAWPGGFAEDTEDGLATAMRELLEETTLDIDEQTLRQCLVGTRVFDDPGRSPRGHIITTACHFRLPNYTRETLPLVFGRDDAKAKPALWLAPGDFAMRMHEMLDDHDVIGEWAMGEMTPLVELQAA